jgi:hypothetical protein
MGHPVEAVMMRRLGRGVFCVVAVTLGTAAGWAQAPVESPGVAATRVQMTALRDAFVKATVDAGYTCKLAPPKVVVEDVPSFGQYNLETNTLRTSAWELLTDEEKSGFLQLLGPGATPAAAQAEFEIGAHHWVFVHEMGHWWQACRGVRDAGNFYAFESGANRIAAAYWREHDSAIVAHQRRVFETVQKYVPAPVKENVEAYFNAHYPDKFETVLDYIWFQARMCLAAFNETPAPTFAKALRETGTEVDASAAIEETRAKMTALRDAFVKATVDAGFTCKLAPPTIVVEDVPSFGQYNPEKNALRTSAWEQMPQRERGIFYQLAGPGASEEAVRAEFEVDAHHWIFVHEMGHWFQACRGVVDKGRHYAQEAGANRIAAAYWRQRDATVVSHMRAAFQMVLDHAPNPVPEGQDVETYFDANYQKLGPSPVYPWFQSRMCVTVMDERPEPTWAQALRVTKGVS